MTTFYGKPDLRDDIIDDQGNTIWDYQAQEIPDASLGSIDNSTITNSSLTVAGNSVSLGGSTGVALADLSDVGTISSTNGHVLASDGTDFDSEDIASLTEAHVNLADLKDVDTTVGNSQLTNSSVTVTAGDGLKNGGSLSLGSSITVDIEPNDFAGNALEDDGSDNLSVSSGGINSNEIATDAVGTSEIDTDGVNTDGIATNAVTTTEANFTDQQLSTSDGPTFGGKFLIGSSPNTQRALTVTDDVGIGIFSQERTGGKTITQFVRPETVTPVEEISRIAFRSFDSNNNELDYARLTADVTDQSDGSEEGRFVFGVQNNGALSSRFSIEGGSSTRLMKITGDGNFDFSGGNALNAGKIQFSDTDGDGDQWEAEEDSGGNFDLSLEGTSKLLYRTGQEMFRMSGGAIEFNERTSKPGLSTDFAQIYAKNGNNGADIVVQNESGDTNALSPAASPAFSGATLSGKMLIGSNPAFQRALTVTDDVGAGNISAQRSGNGANMELFRTDQPASGEIGLFNYAGKDDAGNFTKYSRTRSFVDDNTDGSEDGHFDIDVMGNGAINNRFRITGGSSTRTMEITGDGNFDFSGGNALNAGKIQFSDTDGDGDQWEITEDSNGNLIASHPTGGTTTLASE